MPGPISPIQPAPVVPVRPLETPAPAGAFQSVLADAIGRVENFRIESDKAIERFLSGEDGDLHKVALATQQAELAFELFLQTKNKVVQAYQEIMRMQV